MEYLNFPKKKKKVSQSNLRPSFIGIDVLMAENSLR